MKTVKFITLGCKTNFYDSAAMAELLSCNDYTITDNEIADIYVVNTCAVTNSGAARSRAAIKRCKKSNPDAVIAVTGCLAQLQSDELAAIDGVTIVSGVERGGIVEMLEKARRGELCSPADDNETMVNFAGERSSPLQEYEELAAVNTQSRVRAVVKIQDGCNNFCSYCIVPYARGRSRSRKLENILAEARELANRGYAEIVLTGINLTSYGADLPEDVELIDVIERISEITRIKRIRLGSLSPTVVTPEFATRAAAIADKLCPQFHLSLQSGSDEILRKMNRKYSSAQYLAAVELLRENIPNAAITTDLIVGFPGESDEQFEESFEFCKRVGFSQMHIFKYSKRAGTVAAEMKNQIPKSEKERRAAKMLKLARDMKSEFYRNYIGEVTEVLFESFKSGKFFGLTPNYMDILVESTADLVGKIKLVRITEFDDENLVGEIVE